MTVKRCAPARLPPAPSLLDAANRTKDGRIYPKLDWNRRVSYGGALATGHGLSQAQLNTEFMNMDLSQFGQNHKHETTHIVTSTASYCLSSLTSC